MKITKRQLRRIIKEEKQKLLNEQLADNVDQIIADGRDFFLRVIELSQESEDDPNAQRQLEQIVAALAPEVEKKSFGYVKFQVTI